MRSRQVSSKTALPQTMYTVFFISLSFQITQILQQLSFLLMRRRLLNALSGLFYGFGNHFVTMIQVLYSNLTATVLVRLLGCLGGQWKRYIYSNFSLKHSKEKIGSVITKEVSTWIHCKILINWHLHSLIFNNTNLQLENQPISFSQWSSKEVHTLGDIYGPQGLRAF